MATESGRGDGPSSRLLRAIEAKNYKSEGKSLIQQLSQDFDTTESTMGRIINSNHVPTRHNLKYRISHFFNISPAYWEYGLDAFSEELTVNGYTDVLRMVLRRILDLGYSLDEMQPGALAQITKIAYNNLRLRGRNSADVRPLPYPLDPTVADEIIALVLGKSDETTTQ